MNILVIGCGQVGASLVRDLERIGHDISLIEKDSEQLKRLDSFDDYTFGGTALVGDPTDPDILKQGGLLLGLSRACVAEFTFYLAIPVMAGASLLKVVKFVLSGVAMTGTEIAVLVVGCIVAFVVSLAAIRFLMDYVKRHNFKIFGVYRIVLGVIVLAVAAVTAIA